MFKLTLRAYYNSIRQVHGRRFLSFKEVFLVTVVVTNVLILHALIQIMPHNASHRGNDKTYLSYRQFSTYAICSPVGPRPRQILHTLQLNINMVKYTCLYRGFMGCVTALLPHRHCYRPAVFFRHIFYCAFTAARKILRAFKKR